MTAISSPCPPRRSASRIRRATVTGVAAGVLIAVLASGTAFGAQGSSTSASSVSPKQWWTTVCSDLNAYTKDTAKYGKDLVAQLNHVTSLSDVRPQFIKFLNNNATRADRLLASLKRAGTPNAPGGNQFATAIQAGFVQLRDGFKNLVPEARTALTGSRAEQTAAIQKLQSELNTLGSQSGSVEQAASQAESPQMTTARESVKSCKSV